MHSFRQKTTIIKRIATIACAIFGIALATSCDSADSGACDLVTDELRTRSVALLGSGSTPVAQFELQQEVKTYAQGCTRADVDEVSLVIRNETTCSQAVTYSVSVFQGQTGWTVNGSVNVAPAAAFDTGVINQGGGVNIETGQVLVSGQAIQGACA